MVDKEDLMKYLDEQSKKFTHEKVVKSFKNWNKIMQYHFTDTDEYYTIKLVNGQPEPVIEGKVDSPDIEYTMSTEIFIALSKKEISGLKAYQQKKIKVKATMPEILKLQKLEKL